MKIKRIFRFSTVLLVLTLLASVLSGCKLPASQGVETAAPSGEQFPVPGETEQSMGGLDVAAFSTQTAQAMITPQPGSNVQNTTVPIMVVTDTPGAPLPPPPVVTSGPALPPGAAPTSAPITYVQPTAGGPPATYTLQPGEFPYCIARRFDVNPIELLNLNGLNLNSNVRPGLVLAIPQTGNHFPGERALRDHPTTYTVQAGDTIYEIACTFGDVSPDMIALQNNLSAPYNLTAGMTLVIP